MFFSTSLLAIERAVIAASKAFAFPFECMFDPVRIQATYSSTSSSVGSDCCSDSPTPLAPCWWTDRSIGSDERYRHIRDNCVAARLRPGAIAGDIGCPSDLKVVCCQNEKRRSAEVLRRDAVQIPRADDVSTSVSPFVSSKPER